MSISWENAFVNGRNNETLEFTADPIINSKIKAIVVGLPRSIANLFLEFPTDHNKEVVANFLDSCIKQENISLNTKRIYLVALAYFVREVKKPLELVTSTDLKTYLSSMQKSQAEDSDQSWISTQRMLGLLLQKFYKWLAYPDLTPQERKTLSKEMLPEVLKGFILHTKKGSKSPIKAKHIWNDSDIGIFLKYCTENPRLRYLQQAGIDEGRRRTA
jgi:hypothetical protein